MKKIILLFITGLTQLGFVQQVYTIEENQLILPTPIVFEKGTSIIKKESEVALKHIKNYLDDKIYITTLRIEGHTSSDGNETKNQDLSEKRALAVGQWLVQKGIDCKRLICTGFGAKKPVSDNSTTKGKSSNNRIAVMNAAIRGRLIGGMPDDGGGKVAGNVCKK